MWKTRGSARGTQRTKDRQGPTDLDPAFYSASSSIKPIDQHALSDDGTFPTSSNICPHALSV